MYEQIKDYVYALKRQITVKRCIIGAGCLLLVFGACQLLDGYFTARANYQRTVERLERTQRELERSRRLNQELKLILERSSELNDQAGRGIGRLEDYQRRTGEGISRAQEYQRSTGARISEGRELSERAGQLIGDSLRIIDRVEAGNQEQQTDGATPAPPAGYLGGQ